MQWLQCPHGRATSQPVPHPAGEPEPAMMLTPTTDVVNNNVVFYHAAARCTASGGVNDG
jgi:hypothetical protein